MAASTLKMFVIERSPMFILRLYFTCTVIRSGVLFRYQSVSYAIYIHGTVLQFRYFLYFLIAVLRVNDCFFLQVTLQLCSNTIDIH